MEEVDEEGAVIGDDVFWVLVLLPVMIFKQGTGMA
jgi:hypothetical protein